MVAFDAPAKVKALAEQRAVAYPILSDPKSEMIRAFGVLNAEYPPGHFAHGVAHPIIFVVDAAGVVRHRFSEARYQERPEIDRVIDALKADARRPR